MTKKMFYSLVEPQKGKTIAALQTGWSDGQFYYYKNDFGTWYCIEPKTGLSVAIENTRAEAQKQAQSRADRIKDTMKTDYYQKCVNRFHKLIAQGAM